MPHTHTRVLVHLVFATRDRMPLIVPEARGRLHAYMAGTCRALKCHVYALGGWSDHCHVVFDLAPTISLAELANRLKAASTKWARRDGGLPAFGWQRGYGAFGLGPRSLDRAVRYVESQEEHHRTRSLREELETLLRLHGMEADPELVLGVYADTDGEG